MIIRDLGVSWLRRVEQLRLNGESNKMDETLFCLIHVMHVSLVQVFASCRRMIHQLAANNTEIGKSKQPVEKYLLFPCRRAR